MGLGAVIITFIPGTLIKSADINSNFSNINNVSNITSDIDGSANSAPSATYTAGISTNGGTLGLSVNASGISTVQLNNGLLDKNGNIYSAWSRFTYTGNGTYNHGWGGATPNMFMMDPVGTGSGVAVSANNATSTTIQTYQNATCTIAACATRH